MNIPKAIEILDTHQAQINLDKAPDLRDAIRLGREALKRITAWRNDNDDDLLWDLEGETE